MDVKEPLNVHEMNVKREGSMTRQSSSTQVIEVLPASRDDVQEEQMDPFSLMDEVLFM